MASGQQIGRFPVELVAEVDAAIAAAGGLESRIEWVLGAVRARLVAEAEAEAEPAEAGRVVVSDGLGRVDSFEVGR